MGQTCFTTSNQNKHDQSLISISPIFKIFHGPVTSTPNKQINQQQNPQQHAFMSDALHNQFSGFFIDSYCVKVQYILEAMQRKIIDLLWNRHSSYFEVEYMQSRIVRIRTDILQSLKKTMAHFQSQANIHSPLQGNKNYSGFHQEARLKTNSSFIHFLTDQCYEIMHGTSSKLIFKHSIDQLQLTYLKLFKYSHHILEQIYTIQSNSLCFQQFLLIQKILKFVNRMLTPSSPQSESLDTYIKDLRSEAQVIIKHSIFKINICQSNTFNDYIPIKVHFKNIFVLLQRTSRQTKLVQQFQTILKSELLEKQKIQSMRSYQIKWTKLCLADILDEYVAISKSKKFVCLNCQNKFNFNEMDSHINLCKAFYTCEQAIKEINTEVQAKIHDFCALSMSIRKVKVQKMKQLQFKNNNVLKSNSKFNNRFSKSLHDSRNRSEFLFEFNKKKQEQSDQETLSHSMVEQFSIKDLTIQDLNKYLQIIEDVKRIAMKVKSQRKQFLSSISMDLKELKRQIKQNFPNLQSKDVIELIHLITKKLKLTQKLKQIQVKMSKKSGEKRISPFQGEYQQIISNKSQSIILQSSSQNQAYSDDESVYTSAKVENNQVCFKDFKKIKKLAQGKYGQVYLVKKIKTGVKYAMKQILIKQINHHGEVEKLQNEKNTFSIINNQFLVKAIFSFSEGTYHYFIMQYAPNGDFADKLMDEQRLFEYEAKPLLAEIAVAINSLHESGVIHRDIKPQNIVIDQEGHLKLTDYGLSETQELKKRKKEAKVKMYSKFTYDKVINREICKPLQTRRQKIVGSPYYMAPEVLSFQPITKMSDWWSFGILIYQTLVGQPPFLGKNLQEISAKILEGNIWWTNQIIFGDSQNMISYQAKDLIQLLLTANPQKRLGQTFEQIKSHKFFAGLNWTNLRQTPSPIQVPYGQDESQPQDEISSQNISIYGSTSPNLILVRRDLLSKHTKLNYYRCLGLISRINKLADSLRNSATL